MQTKQAWTQEQRNAVADWLSELDSHSIYDSGALELELAEKVLGVPTNWPSQTQPAVKRAMDRRGLGGTIAPDDGKRLATGHEIAEFLAVELAGFRSRCHGRGSIHRSCIAALRGHPAR